MIAAKENTYTAAASTGQARPTSGATEATTVLNITASDLTGQKRARLTSVPPDATIGELVEGLLPRLRLQQLDSNGMPVHYEARLEREERHLHSGELAGEALQPEDHIVLHPRIMAGAGSASCASAGPRRGATQALSSVFVHGEVVPSADGARHQPRALKC